jgi:hypothetical protein
MNTSERASRLENCIVPTDVTVAYAGEVYEVVVTSQMKVRSIYRLGRKPGYLMADSPIYAAVAAELKE